MRGWYIFFIAIFSGCAPKLSSPPADIWGVVSTSYEATKESGHNSKSYSRGGVATTVAIEKSFGSLGFGGEVAGRD